MTAILGRSLVLVALALAVATTVTGFSAGHRGDEAGVRATRLLTWLGALALALAVGLLEAALVGHDFSVAYVTEVGSRRSPTWLAIASLWSSLNGSILLWAFVHSALAGVLAWVSRRHPVALQGHALGALAVTSVFFTGLVATQVNPFDPVWPVPSDGPGPNPVLQNHLLMVVHPPALYIGYVGMAVPFAMAVAALLTGTLPPAWLRTLRRFTLWTWSFLTLGIVLGGWWSYEVLGWGGYWAWDPVENASFLPWLTTTAFVHSAMITERRRRLPGWTLSLALGSYLLTLLGTFMTRSGVFNSVHAFTQSPIGPVFLAFIGLVLTASVILLASGLDKLQPAEGGEGIASREGTFLLQNLTFSAFTFTVLLGTLYPLVHEWMTGAKLSVGAPYFNRMCVPLAVALLVLMGLGPALPWGRLAPREILRLLLVPLGTAVAGLLLALALGSRAPWELAAYAMAAFAAAVSVRVGVEVVRTSRSRGLVDGLLRNRRRLAAHGVHLAVVVCAVAIAASQVRRSETDVLLAKGESTLFEGYTLTFQDVDLRTEEHRRIQAARILVEEDGVALGVMEPALNQYRNSKQPVGSPAVRTTASHDLYLSVLDLPSDGGSVRLRVMREPLVAWLWVAGIAMTLFGLLAAWPRRAAGRPAASTGAQP